jgi:hypothetical protein
LLLKNKGYENKRKMDGMVFQGLKLINISIRSSQENMKDEGL